MSITLPTPPGLQPRPSPRAPQLDRLTQEVDRLLNELPETRPPTAALGDQILVLQRQVNRLHSLLLDRLALFDAQNGAHVVAGATTTSWLRHRGGLAAGQTSDLVRTARHLSKLPATRASMRAGDLTSQHVRTISHTIRSTSDHLVDEHRDSVAAEVERVMVEVGRGVDAGSLSGFAQRVRQITDPDGALSDANRAHDRRWFTAARTLEGMVNLEGLLDPQAGATLLTVLAAASVPAGPKDDRTAAQRRADALVELCRQALDHGQVSSTGGVSPHLLVTTSLDSLRNVKELAVSEMAVQEAATLEWAGAIPPETARRLACDATLSRVLVDPDGLPLDIGRATRVVPPAIRTALVVRDGGCVADCCDRPPSWTEAHHIHHWIDGGKTSLDNLVLLCRTHHRKIHEERWTLTSLDGRWRLRPP